jgi:hypothetical protein
LRVVDLVLVDEHVAVRVGGDGEAALPDELADARPGYAAQVQQADAAVTQVVRAKQGNSRSATRLRNRGAERVGPLVREQPRVRIAILA